MSKRHDDRQNVVIVGGGYAGYNAAKILGKTLDMSKYNVLLIISRPYFINMLAGIRILVTGEEKLEDTAFVPYDRLAGVTHRVGTVTAIEEAVSSKGGNVVLKDGERISYAALVLATGSTWDGPLTAFGDNDGEIRSAISEWRDRYSNADHVVVVGGGAVGIETAGEIREAYPSKKVTLVHGDKLLLNSAYPDKFRKLIESHTRARGIDLVLGDYVDTFPEPGVVGIVTRKGLEVPDADLVVTAFGSRPNTSVIESLGAGVLTETNYVKVKSTLELPEHPGIFAAGDIINWREQKQAGKAPAHAAVVAANVASFLAGHPQKKVYKGSTEMIIIPVGKQYGAGYFDILWGITIGNWLSSIFKGRSLGTPMFRGQLGY